ncbi:MAG TPA: CU044_5270 family protein [Streptosporangiaceae bacterium]
MDLDTMLAEAAPARHVSLDGPDSPAAIRLYQRITAQPPAADPARRRRRIALTATAIAAAGAAVALALLPSPPRTPGSPHTEAAAAVLARAALTAAHQSAAATAGPGHYLYVETIEGDHNSQPGAPSGICVQTVQVWTAPDGSGRATAGAPAGPCGSFIPSQAFPKGAQIDLTVYPRAADLPADPAALEQFIAQRFIGGHQDTGATFEFAGTFLQSGAPSRVRAALYRMIENLPDIESLGPMTDKLGRHGVGVGFTEHGVRDVLIFDPATSAVLEREGIAVDPSHISRPPGYPQFRVNEVINYTVYKASGVVNSITAVPSAASSSHSPGA